MPSDPRATTDRASPVPRLGRAVAVFIAVTFGFTWLTALPLVVAPPLNVMPWYFYAGEAGPALGAVAATLVLRPPGGLSVWATRTFSFVGIGRAVIVAVVSLVLYLGLGILVEQIATGSLDRLPSLGLTTKLPGIPAIVVLLIWVLTAGIGEETGWRGWLMPTLTSRFGFVVAALMVAAVWMLWHAPQFLFNPGFQGMGWAAIGWAVSLVAGSFWLGWLARLGRWSIIPVVLWHGGFDLLTSSDLGPATFPATVSTIVIVQALVVVGIMVGRRGRR
ncbi:type II CAAX prenyl endopeptidase Rce1 family protein [Leifsonia sp. NPDC058248]|uniref:CPBP family glutamic-type intramembrane protease n=1 Tax=Leifsonia sp. NPDC058248 TaxID=3346402 RepID=UPI0036DC3CFB